MKTLVAAFDTFRGSIAATEACEAACRGARAAGWRGRAVPMADGGEGTLEALGGANRVTRVTGPLGARVEAPWRLDGGRAVIEMSRASGLALIGGAEANDPVAATSRGTGELLRAALDAGARELVVALGGSATTDGGAGVLEVVPRLPEGVELHVLCDVTTCFVDSAARFGPQKGADAAQVQELTERLQALAERFAAAGRDVRELPGSGAAGGLGGGLAFLGGQLHDGCAWVAAAVGLAAAVADADLVVTGEGCLDATSWQGKVVDGVCRLAPERTWIVAGQVRVPHPRSVSLVERFGDRAWSDPAACIEAVVVELAYPTRRVGW